MRRSLFGILLVCLATQLQAGAWPREQGKTFLSLSHTTATGARTLLAPELDLNNYTSIYAEYGLTENITIGLEGGYGGDRENTVSAALVFVRHPLWTGETGHRVAVDFGLGQIDDDVNGKQSRVRPGLSWGYGFESRWGSGWLGIESSADFRQPTGDVAVKADVTAGIKPSDRTMLILQVQNGLYPDAEPLVRIVPSVVRRFGERMHVQAGAFATVLGDDAIGGKLAVWFSF